MIETLGVWVTMIGAKNSVVCRYLPFDHIREIKSVTQVTIK